MAFFNPHKVDFNYDTRMIDAVGAVGKSLWDIYKTNVEKNQNQAKLDETNRANLATEGLYDARNQETARHNLAGEVETARKNAFDQDLSLKNFYSTDALRRAQINNLYADNARQNAQFAFTRQQAQDKARDEQEKQAGIDMAWYNAGQQGGQFGELPADLSDADKRNLGRRYRLQTEAQGGIDKAQEPILKQQEAQRKQKQIDAEADIIFLQLGGQIPQGMTDPQAQREYINAFAAAKTNPQLVKQTETSAGQKNAIALTQRAFNNNLKELSALDRVIIAANNTNTWIPFGNSGISNLGGPFDKVAYAASEWSPASRSYKKAVENYASAYSDNQKGQGKFNYENMNDRLTPNIFGAGNAAETIKTRRAQLISELYQQAKQAKEQGYKGADEMLNQVKSLAASDESIKGILYGKREIDSNFGAARLYDTPQDKTTDISPSAKEATQLFMQKMGMPVSAAPINSAPPRGYSNDDLRQKLDAIGIFNEDF